MSRRNFLQLTSCLLDVKKKKKEILKTDKSDSDFQLWTETPRTPNKKNTRYCKFFRVPPRGSPAATAEGVLLLITKPPMKRMGPQNSGGVDIKNSGQNAQRGQHHM